VKISWEERIMTSFPKEQVDIFWKKDEEVIQTGNENINEETITDSNGVIRTIVTKKTLFTDQEGNKFIVGIIRDITDRKQIEESLREPQLSGEPFKLRQCSDNCMGPII
jgi:PAS domain S-box-containing protein